MTALTVIASRDNGLVKGSPNNNYGLAGSLLVGGSITAFTTSSLLFFDLSGLEAGTIINSAVLSLWTQGAIGVQVHGVYLIPLLDIGWIEGASNSPAAVGETCWNWQAYATVAWSGGAGCIGGTLLGTIDRPGVAGVEVTLALAAAVVQAWVGPGGANPGLIVAYYSGASRVTTYTSRHNTSNKPSLIMDVTYPSPPQEPESASGFILEYSLDGVNYVDISGMACEVVLAGGERGVGEAYRYPADTAAIVSSKRGPVDVTIRLLYQEEAAFPCEVFRQAMEAEDRIWLRWAPLDKGGVGHLWYTTDPDCVIADFGYPDGEAGPGEPMMVGLATRAEHIITSVKTS